MLYPTFMAEMGGERGRYLSLLKLYTEAEALEAFEALQRALQASPAAEDEICAQLQGADWRNHLVAGTAVLFGGVNPRTVAAVWSALDQGSWVSPQLAVILSLVDTEFVPQARRRLLELRESTDSYGLHGPQAHVLRGPGGPDSRSAKACSALLQRLWVRTDERLWLRHRFALDEVVELMLVRDPDRGAELAHAWAAPLARLCPDLKVEAGPRLPELLEAWLGDQPSDLIADLVRSSYSHDVLVNWLMGDGVSTVVLAPGQSQWHILRNGHLWHSVPATYGRLISTTLLFLCLWGPDFEMSYATDTRDVRVTRYTADPAGHVVLHRRRTAVRSGPRLQVSRERLETAEFDMLCGGIPDSGDQGGGTAAALLQAAGPRLRTAVHEALAQSPRTVGTVLVTPPFDLASRGVLWLAHVIAKGHSAASPTALSDAVLEVLAQARERHVRSVAFAALGTSSGQMDPATVARQMVQTVRHDQQKHDQPEHVEFRLPGSREYDLFQRLL